MDRAAWQDTVHGVQRATTKPLTHTYFHILSLLLPLSLSLLVTTSLFSLSVSLFFVCLFVY